VTFGTGELYSLDGIVALADGSYLAHEAVRLPEVLEETGTIVVLRRTDSMAMSRFMSRFCRDSS